MPKPECKCHTVPHQHQENASNATVLEEKQEAEPPLE
jgi:hypothetical protein